MVTAVRRTSSWPLPVKLLSALLGTLACFLIQLPLETRSFGDPFAVFLGCAFLVALLFGRLPGALAVLVSSVLSSLFFEPFGLPHLLRGISIPSLVVWSSADAIVPRSCAEAYRDALGGHYAEIPGGHMAEYEAPDALAALVEELLGC